MNASTSALQAEGLSIGYGGRVVAAGIDLALPQSEVTCLLGPNGVGKTTLFKTLLGLLPPLGGKVMLGEADISAMSRDAVARRIAYVPQSYDGAFAYTVLDLVVMGRTAHLGAFTPPGKADVAIAMQALERLGVADLAERDANRISGGQRQLALIARALAQQAGIIVMDEPTASLDLGNRVLVLDTVQALANEGLAVLLSTHEPEQALAIANGVALLEPNQPFATGNAIAMLTGERLSRLYGVPLMVERTLSGRRVVTTLAKH
ncbi:MAG: transporter related [Xanthobacteraceae bacterium]|jgi:iron complex transport system ATP-binding protein|nr:transporter related [Xanthobacteraceae bacterium]